MMNHPVGCGEALELTAAALLRLTARLAATPSKCWEWQLSQRPALEIGAPSLPPPLGRFGKQCRIGEQATEIQEALLPPIATAVLPPHPSEGASHLGLIKLPIHSEESLAISMTSVGDS